MGLLTQQDPIGIAGGLNLYGYANGDPINFSDPFGLEPCETYGFPEGAACYGMAMALDVISKMAQQAGFMVDVVSDVASRVRFGGEGQMGTQTQGVPQRSLARLRRPSRWEQLVSLRPK